MSEADDDHGYEIFRMCPIGIVKFFFTISCGPGKKMHICSEKFDSEPYNEDM